MATMDDIAKRLGVSKGTVSKALSGAADYQAGIVPLTWALQEEMRYDAYMLQEGYEGGFFLGLTLLDP